MNVTRATVVLSSLMCCSVQAASVFTPTDGTINFLPLLGNSPAVPEVIGLFDDADISYSGSYLAIQSGGDQAIFTANGGDFCLTNTSGIGPNSFKLSGTSHFLLAAWAPSLSTWLAPDAVTCSVLSGSCTLTWSGFLTELGVDLASAPNTAIPVPSSAMLLGAGAFGLVAVARRRASGEQFISV